MSKRAQNHINSQN